MLSAVDRTRGEASLLSPVSSATPAVAGSRDDTRGEHSWADPGITAVVVSSTGLTSERALQHSCLARSLSASLERACAPHAFCPAGRQGQAPPVSVWPPTPLLSRLEEDSAIPITVPGRLPVSLAGHPVVAAQAAAVQAAAAQAAVAAQAAALEQLREKLESGEPPEKKMALVADEQHRLMQRALQQNFLAMTAQLPMSIRINSQGTSPAPRPSLLPARVTKSGPRSQHM